MIDWIDSQTFELSGQRYLLADGSRIANMRSSPGNLVLGKVRRMVDRFVDQNASRDDVRRIFELGIYQGGSIALEYEVCGPDRLVAIDLDPERVVALDEFISERGLEDRIHLYYGVDQADRDALTTIVGTEFAGAPLDLVIDDASHLYEPTRSSFEVLFPHLREGGMYVIEDWDWAHYPGDQWQLNGGQYADYPALTNLVIEILMLAGTSPEIVSEVTISQSLTEVVRGPAKLDGPMRLADLYLNRGLPFRAML
jgi:predicted O-methyltransferase YrrM